MIWDGFRANVTGADLLDLSDRILLSMLEIVSGNITVFWQNNMFLFTKRDLTCVR
ncbi:hypothetical protein XCR1_1430076 [Xenorhabdus cabanillasii JM26]|uniref:Uncharacterized protein n=1 Tax=Xenorhabdus cabanillasii JM26 TaxID=1427517 RepID=W1IPE8_9GAMM|nr:hypothetical protein XCR1_1430076 [Xenorhabdus cabanillasii JM26]